VIKLQNNNLRRLPPPLAKLNDHYVDIDASNNPNLQMIPESLRGCPNVIMWILSVHEKNSKDIDEISKATKELGNFIKSSKENIEAIKKSNDILLEEKTQLLMERSSIENFLIIERKFKTLKKILKSCKKI